MTQQLASQITDNSVKRLAVIACTLLAIAAHAEQVYVSDKLVANLTDQASSDGKKITTVESGDVLEVLERADGYVHVRTEKGNEGWIKSSYVMTQVPALRRLKELESTQIAPDSPGINVAKYTQEIAQLQERNKTLEGEVTSLKKAAEEARASVQSPVVDQPDAAVTVTTATPAAEFATATASTSLLTPPVLGALTATYLIVGALGFAWGYKALAARIRRKYGRMKIY